MTIHLTTKPPIKQVLLGHDVFYWLGRCFFDVYEDYRLAKKHGDFDGIEPEPCEYMPFDSGYSVVVNEPAYFKYLRN